MVFEILGIKMNVFDWFLQRNVFPKKSNSFIKHKINSLYTFPCRTNIRKFAIRFQGHTLSNRINLILKMLRASPFLTFLLS